MVKVIINLSEEENKFLNIYKAHLGIKSKNDAVKKLIQEHIKREKDDLEFAKRTEEAYQRYERGEFKTLDSKEFIKKMESLIKNEDES